MKSQDVTGTPGEHAIIMVFGVRGSEKAEQAVKALCDDFSAVRGVCGRCPSGSPIPSEML